MNRRQFLTRSVTFTFAAGMLLAGCGRKGVPGARVTLTQWYHQYGEAGTQEAVLRYAREYTKLHPDVAIQVVWVPGDYGTKLSTALLTPNGPDIFESTLTAAMVGAEQVAPLDDLFTPEAREDFSERDIATNSYNGKIYAVKMLDDMGLLYYRKSALASAGVEPPTTMDALIAASKKLSSGNQKGLFIGNDGGVSSLLNILPWSAGSDFLVDNKIVFNNPRTVAAYEKLKELNDAGGLLIGAPNDWWDPSALNQKQVAMQWTGLWAYPAIYKALGEDVGAMAWPAFDAKGVPVTFSGGWSQMINAQSPHIEDAKKFVQWLWIENTKNQQDWCLSYGFHVPPRGSIAQSAMQLRRGVPEKAVKILETSGRFLPPIWNGAMGSALTDAVSNIVKSGRSAATELETAAKKCERELERALW